jgi:hypothetical protein
LDLYRRQCKVYDWQMMMMILRQRLCTQPKNFYSNAFKKSADQLAKYTEKQGNYAEK